MPAINPYFCHSFDEMGVDNQSIIIVDTVSLSVSDGVH